MAGALVLQAPIQVIYGAEEVVFYGGFVDGDGVGHLDGGFHVECRAVSQHAAEHGDVHDAHGFAQQLQFVGRRFALACGAGCGQGIDRCLLLRADMRQLFDLQVLIAFAFLVSFQLAELRRNGSGPLPGGLLAHAAFHECFEHFGAEQLGALAQVLANRCFEQV